MKKLLATAALFSLTGIVESQSITEVQNASDDRSLEYMRILFGDAVNIITGGQGPANPDSILGAMSGVLNTGMLYFTGLIIGYVAITGALNSAHEGSPLGKAYNTMWIPLRMTLAMALVLPFAGGFSAMQIGVLWLAGQGVGLANSTWNAGLDYMESSGALYPPPVTLDFEQTGKNILNSRMCLEGINHADQYNNIELNPLELVSNNQTTGIATANSVTAADLSPPGQIVGQRYDSFFNPISASGAYTAAFINGFSAGVPRYYGANPCGKITLEFSEMDEAVAIDTAVAAFQNNVTYALADLDEQLGSLAQDITLNYFNINATTPNPHAFNNAVGDFKNDYLAAVNQGAADFGNARIGQWANGNPETASMAVGARDAGWLSVGAWYWDLQRVTAETHKLVSVDMAYIGPNGSAKSHADYEAIELAYNDYTGQMFVTDPYGQTVPALERSTYANENYSLSAVMFAARLAIDQATSSPDPIAGAANLGHVVIGTLESAWTAVGIARIISETALETARQAPGPLSMAAGIVAGAKALLENSTAALMLATTLLLPFALMLAFYLPATPLILWIMGVAGWFVLLIEAIIAAPIWAATHAMPEGDGFVGQRAQAGYMVMLSLFLRPTLMVFGFFAAALLMIVMGKVVGFLFLPAMASMIGDSLSGLLTFVAMIAIFSLLLVQIAHRCYGLIHEIPDKVLRYVGGGAENLGEASQEQGTRQIFIAGAAKISNAGERHMSQGMKAGTGDATPGTDQPTSRGLKDKMGKMLRS